MSFPNSREYTSLLIFMKIATIVSSNSHIEYLARVVDAIDSRTPPLPGDYGFGSFVVIETGNDTGDVVGTVFNSMLMNPDYANYGPRLSSKPELASFSPDFLDEQGCLLAIILLGGKAGKEPNKQGFPHPVIPAGADVRLMTDDEIEQFHTDGEGSISLAYYAIVVSHAGTFAAPLLEAIIDRLQGLEACRPNDRRKLDVLRRSLVWQRTMGQMRL